MRRLPLLLTLLPALIFAANTEWHRVALDTAVGGDLPAHAGTAATWHYEPEGIPTALLPAADPARWCLFGAPLVLDYQGLKPAARYKVHLTLLSDAHREEKISANGQVLAADVALEQGKIVEVEYELPAGSYAAGTLQLVIDLLQGPNAVASAVELLSDDPTPLPAAAEAPVDIAPPRLSPQPATVEGVKEPKLDLTGTWRFNPAPPEGFQGGPETGDGWHDVTVPGEWEMAGFHVAPKAAAGYRKTFTVPAGWAGNRVKLKADAVYSECVVWVNGKEAGRHLGGFTPFELDITDLLKPGENLLALAVKNDSVANTISSGSGYADHPLGGITRKIYLFALPPVNIAALDYETRFDADFKDADLRLMVDLVNEGRWEAGPDLTFSLARDTNPQGAGLTAPVPLGGVKSVRLKPGELRHLDFTAKVPAPLKWDPEHPNLYRLEAKLYIPPVAAIDEIVSQPIGFRKVEVRGNQVFWNGVPIKLRGVCRHEVDPVGGRAGTAKWARRDAELFRDGNCNFIRTSHYPATEEFLDACDELGLLVGSEAPICWSPGVGHREAVVRQELEMVRHNRNHPCIVYWSLGNESGWGPDYRDASLAIRAFEPMIPRIFSTGGGYDGKWTELISMHYPGLGAPAAVAKSAKPRIFDEYIHLNCYNRRELETDPGLRDVWGEGFAEMWERMRQSQGCLGGSIWAAIDDTFFLPDGRTVGYGPWGPIDGWRRPKPEYWHMKQVYCPLRVTPVGELAAGQKVMLDVENRLEFSDLNEVQFLWTCGRWNSKPRVSAAPGQHAKLEIPADAVGPGAWLDLTAYSPRDFVLNTWRWPVGQPPALPDVKAIALAPPVLTRGDGTLTVACGDRSWVVDAASGQFRAPLLGGPHLALIPIKGQDSDQFHGHDSFAPLTDVQGGWKATEVAAKEGDQSVEIAVKGACDGAEGGYTLRFAPGAALTIDYEFRITKAVDPRQVGLVLDLPRTWDTLSWKRKAQWTVYPEDHIGRPEGTAEAETGHPLVTTAGPRTQPTWSWSDDANALGSNDFRSTKRHLISARLTDRGNLGLTITGAPDAHQALRCWLDGQRVRALVADYDNEGGAPFFNEHLIPRRPLAVGAVVSGQLRCRAWAP
jgi:hypothetical protein